MGTIKGVKMNVAGSAFTHVMYADDIMVSLELITGKLKYLMIVLTHIALGRGRK